MMILYFVVLLGVNEGGHWLCIRIQPIHDFKWFRFSSVEESTLRAPESCLLRRGAVTHVCH